MPGKYFEEWSVGDTITHQPSRTVTETDNLMFSAMTHNMQPLHLDAEYAKASEFGQTWSIRPSPSASRWGCRSPTPRWARWSPTWVSTK